MFVNLDWTLSTGILAVAKFPEQEDSLAHLLPERPLRRLQPHARNG